MKVYQLVYTKVPPEESPWGELDFHTVFYPINLLTKNDLLEIEKRIHFPSYEGFDHKETVFFQKIQNKTYLILLYLKNLPHDRDTFGRGGIFITHGFIFPPEIWKLTPTYKPLFDLVKNHLFTNRKDLLSSSLVNKQTGDIKPIEISEEILNKVPKELPKLKDEFELKISVLFNRFLCMGENKPALLLKGDPDNISHFVNRLFAYIPSKLKQKFAYDSALDEGTLLYYPIKIVGFKNTPPTGGNQIRIDVEERTIEEEDEFQEFLIPQTPYQKWIYKLGYKIQSKNEIDKAYELSLFLEGKTPPPHKKGLLPNKKDFASINRKKIEDVFIKEFEKYMDGNIAKAIATKFEAEKLLDLLLEEMPIERLVEYVEDIILEEKIVPDDKQQLLSEDILKQESYLLKLIVKLWNGKVIKPEDLNKFEKEKRYEFIKYLLFTKYGDKEWVLNILINDPTTFNHFISSSDTKEKVLNLIKKYVKKQKNIPSIPKIILKEPIMLGRLFELLKGEISLFEILEKSIKENLIERLDEKEVRELIKWAKKIKPPDEKRFPYVRAFLYPKKGIPDSILKDRNTKARLDKWLLHFYRYKIKDKETKHIKSKKEEKSKKNKNYIKDVFKEYLNKLINKLNKDIKHRRDKK